MVAHRVVTRLLADHHGVPDSLLALLLIGALPFVMAGLGTVSEEVAASGQQFHSTSLDYTPEPSSSPKNSRTIHVGVPVICTSLDDDTLPSAPATMGSATVLPEEPVPAPKPQPPHESSCLSSSSGCTPDSFGRGSTSGQSLEGATDGGWLSSWAEGEGQRLTGDDTVPGRSKKGDRELMRRLFAQSVIKCYIEVTVHSYKSIEAIHDIKEEK
jgi:hypothetical protein